MTLYNLQSRLRHVGDRMNVINVLYVKYVSVRSAVTYTIFIHASPILISPEEMGIPRDPSITRVERQDWVTDISELDNLYPPLEGDKVIDERGNEYRVKPMGMDEPCYSHVTSTRDRVMFHTIRTKVGTA